MVDEEKGRNWEVDRGLALYLELQGEVLQKVPYMTAFDWAWEDFYPHTEFFGK